MFKVLLTGVLGIGGLFGIDKIFRKHKTYDHKMKQNGIFIDVLD